MQTRIMTVDGKKHVIDGRPEDLMQIVRGVGVIRRDLIVTTVKGKKVHMEDVMMMHVIQRNK